MKDYKFSVNSGVTQANKLLQRSLSVKPDGKIGPITLGAIRDICGENLAVSQYMIQRTEFYDNIITNNPKLNKFEKGWKNRLSKLSKFIEEM